jgi:hypothetical protein
MSTLQNSLQNNTYSAISNGKSIFFCTSTHRFSYLVLSFYFVRLDNGFSFQYDIPEENDNHSRKQSNEVLDENGSYNYDNSSNNKKKRKFTIPRKDE